MIGKWELSEDHITVFDVLHRTYIGSYIDGWHLGLGLRIIDRLFGGT